MSQLCTLYHSCIGLNICNYLSCCILLEAWLGRDIFKESSHSWILTCYIDYLAFESFWLGLWHWAGKQTVVSLWLTELKQSTPPWGLNKLFGLKFHVASRVQQETAEEGWSAHQLKHWESNSNDEDNSLNNLNDKNYWASPKKFQQIYIYVLYIYIYIYI